MHRDQIFPGASDIPMPDITDFDEDEEFDQLDSDSDGGDVPPEARAPVVASKKTRVRRSGERKQGQTLVPAPLLQNILHADGMTGINMSKEALFVLSIATEEVVKRMSQHAYNRSREYRHASVHYKDIAWVPQGYPEFFFLEDTIPRPVPLALCFRPHRNKDDELLDEDASMSMSGLVSVSGSMSAMTRNDSQLSKSKVRARPSNGKEKTNGSVDPNKKERRRDSKGRWSTVDDHVNGDFGESVSTGPHTGGRGEGSRNTRVSSHDRESRPRHSRGRSWRGADDDEAGLQMDRSNGSVHMDAQHQGHLPFAIPLQTYAERYGSIPGSSTSHEALDSHIPSYEERWPGQYTGPASGFLGQTTQHPGRTIYSQQRRPPSAS